MAAAWLVWLASLVYSPDIAPLAMAIANFSAAYVLVQMARAFPAGVRRALRGLAWGLLILAMAELLLGYEGLSKVELATVHEAMYTLGVLVIAYWGTYFSWAIEGLGLRDKGHGVRVFATALLGSLVITLPIYWLQAITLIQLLYALVTFYLTLLFVLQLVVMMGIRLRQSLQNMAWAMVLVSIARLVSIFGGSEQALLYGVFWLGAMSLLAWGGSQSVK